MTNGRAAGYVKAIWEQEALIAVSPPNGPVAVGDIFEMRGGVPVRVGSLADKGIAFTVRPQNSTQPAMVVQAENGVKFDAIVDGKVPAGITLSVLKPTDIGAVVSLHGEDAFLLSLKDVSSAALDDITALSDDFRQLFWKNEWDTKWIVATEVFTAESGTFMSSSSDDNTVEVKAKAGIGAAALTAVDLAAGVTVVHQSSASQYFEAASHITPFFRGTKLSWTIIGGAVGARPMSVDEAQALKPGLSEGDLEVDFVVDVDPTQG